VQLNALSVRDFAHDKVALCFFLYPLTLFNSMKLWDGRSEEIGGHLTSTQTTALLVAILVPRMLQTLLSFFSQYHDFNCCVPLGFHEINS
jgi:hypothetical protein